MIAPRSHRDRAESYHDLHTPNANPAGNSVPHPLQAAGALQSIFAPVPGAALWRRPIAALTSPTAHLIGQPSHRELPERIAWDEECCSRSRTGWLACCRIAFVFASCAPLDLIALGLGASFAALSALRLPRLVAFACYPPVLQAITNDLFII